MDWISEKKIQIESNIFGSLNNIDNDIERLVNLQNKSPQCEELKVNLNKLMKEWKKMKNELEKKIETSNLFKRIDNICTRLDGICFSG
ncbi:hypothetical protein SNEBB_008084 [Seison nebaliae]|nr:hypothetical protein SNEBB_008084 [Seison nebaliae]